MPFVSPFFARRSRFTDPPLGAVFQFAGLAAHQICIKAEGPARGGRPWILVLGGGTAGSYPSPWYGAMEDVRERDVQAVGVDYVVTPTGLAVDRGARKPVFPGYLINRGRRRFGVILEGRLCIDLSTGRRFTSDLTRVAIYAEWALRFTEAGQLRTVFQFPIPEGVAADSHERDARLKGV